MNPVIKTIYRYTLLLLGLQLLTGPARAVVPGVPRWMEHFLVLNSPDLSYRYTIQLVNDKGMIADSINGRLYKEGKKYLDSSTIGITAVDGSYFCKLDHGMKSAMIYNLQALEHRMNVSFADAPSGMMIFPDTVIARYGHLKTDSNAQHYIIHLTIAAPETNVKLTAVLSRKSLQLEQVTVDMAEPGSTDKEPWRRRCILYEIHQGTVPGIFNLQRFFTLSGNNAVLCKNYSSYKLTSIIN